MIVATDLSDAFNVGYGSISTDFRATCDIRCSPDGDENNGHEPDRPIRQCEGRISLLWPRASADLFVIEPHAPRSVAPAPHTIMIVLHLLNKRVAESADSNVS